MKNTLDLLGQIQSVEAPPFLLTRIRQRIDEAQQAGFSPRLIWSFGVSLLVLLCLNVAVILKQSPATRTDSYNNLAVSMNLVPDNSLYK